MASNIAVLTNANRDSRSHAVFAFSVMNMSTSTVAAGAYRLELYIDTKLTCWDRSSSIILPGKSTDYTCPLTNVSGEHGYRFELISPVYKSGELRTNTVASGTFDIGRVAN
jgi:hypothetical protein